MHRMESSDRVFALSVITAGVYWAAASAAAVLAAFAHGSRRPERSPAAPFSLLLTPTAPGAAFGPAVGSGWLYWTAFAILLAVLGHLLWPRGTQSSLRHTLARMPRRLAGPAGVVAAVALLVVGGSGAWIFVNTNVWNEYETREDADERLADAEKELLQFEKLPQPVVTDVKLDLDLHPRDDPDEAVARAGAMLEPVTGVVRHGHRERREGFAGDLGGHGIGHGEQALVDPAPHGVVAHTQQTGGPGHTVGRHDSIMPHARVIVPVRSRICGVLRPRHPNPRRPCRLPHP